MKYDECFYERILELNKIGKNSKEISKELNCCAKTVQRFLKSKGLNYKFLISLKEKNKCLNCTKECNFKFCSRSCSATYNNRKNLSIKRIIEIERKKEIALRYKDYKGSERIKKIAEDKILNEDFTKIKDISKIRKRVILEQEGKCSKCNLSHWFDQKLTLELEHKDGNNKNNNRYNLEALCPNCHSLTNTWRGRNRKDLVNRKFITKEELRDAYLKSKNVRNALLSLNLVAKGRNYQRLYDALDSFDINYIKQSKIQN